MPSFNPFHKLSFRTSFMLSSNAFHIPSFISRFFTPATRGDIIIIPSFLRCHQTGFLRCHQTKHKGGIDVKSEKTCKNCIKGIRIHVNNDILCPLKGAVSPGYVCGRHKHISDSEPVFYKKNKCVHCANFLVNRDKENTYSTIGRCSLFSVRYFDGSQKNACSKFEHKQERDVS